MLRHIILDVLKGKCQCCKYRFCMLPFLNGYCMKQSYDVAAEISLFASICCGVFQFQYVYFSVANINFFRLQAYILDVAMERP